MGAFEQAGGLMNLYAKQKTDRMLMGIELPASWFQSLNSFYNNISSIYWWILDALEIKRKGSFFTLQDSNRNPNNGYGIHVHEICSFRL